ncbi:hypothetical protein BLA29_010635, partial [Euroglyphus maynei]
METGRWTMAGESTSPSLRVDKLIEGHEYSFRVKAVNREGESAWLTGKESIVAKNPFDVASKPMAPQVVDVDADHVDLEFRPPRNDGGTPITEYIIEKKPKKSPFWQEAVRVAATKPKAGEEDSAAAIRTTVPDLIEGEEYEFRVIAVNKAGPSEPSDPSEAVICRPTKVPPSIDLAAMKDIRVRVGRAINFTVPYKGTPCPTATWSINGKDVVVDKRVECENIAASAIINIPNSVRD